MFGAYHQALVSIPPSLYLRKWKLNPVHFQREFLISDSNSILISPDQLHREIDNSSDATNTFHSLLGNNCIRSHEAISFNIEWDRLPFDEDS